ncbi:hypothetical protein MAR_004511 [Mya arenaria]|uniref:Uncharacterized protein n=1 Tax=Mya arenaria TaxID=6604 RepID=A0ABY7F0I0_MYAAR|nr:hypothetical protein MAR_004511 [Mya arenaria]
MVKDPKNPSSLLMKRGLVLLRDLIRAFRKKWPEIVGKFYLHHGNAPPHTWIDIKTIQHPAYSSDLAPCDFWSFPTIKNELRGSRFDDIKDLPVVVRQCIRIIT